LTRDIDANVSRLALTVRIVYQEHNVAISGGGRFATECGNGGDEHEESGQGGGPGHDR
jgi:hypothetical protein